MNYHFTREQLDRLLQQAIEMFIEYRDVHGCSEDNSRNFAVSEMLSGLDADRELVAFDPTEHLHLQLKGDWTMYTLLSTVVAPKFAPGYLELLPVEITAELLERVDHNLCGHPLTNQVLKQICPTLPDPERAFWDGSTEGLAIRPRGGVRASTAEGDTQVTLADLEAVIVSWYSQ